MPVSARSKRTAAFLVAALGVSTVLLVNGNAQPQADAAVTPGSTVRASVDNNGRQSQEGGYEQQLSADGRSIVFTAFSPLDNLPQGEQTDVFVRDLARNRTVQIDRGQFTRITSSGSGTTSPTTTTTTTTTTSDGPIVRLAGPKLLDLNAKAAAAQGGVTLGEVAPDNSAYDATISADGRYVAFVTLATNIVESDASGNASIVLCDRDPDGDGDFDERNPNGSVNYRYYLITNTAADRLKLTTPSAPRLSGDASRIVWQDYVSNQEPVAATASLRTPGGQIGEPTEVTLVDVTVSDTQPRLTGVFEPAISGDGQHIVVHARYFDDRNSGGGTYHAIVEVPVAPGPIHRVDVESNLDTKVGLDESVMVSHPVISDDGSVVAFEAEKWFYSLPPPSCDCSGYWYQSDQPNVYVVHVDASGQPTDSSIQSKDNEGNFINGALPGLSGDGRYLAFVTDNLLAHDGIDQDLQQFNCLLENNTFTASRPLNLNALPPSGDQRDTRTYCQIVVRDLVVDRSRLVSEQNRLPGSLVSAGTGRACQEGGLAPGDACAGNNDSPDRHFPYSRGSSPVSRDLPARPPSLTTDGSQVGFESDASDLVDTTSDTNQRTDVFVRTFEPGLTGKPLDFGDVTIGDTVNSTATVTETGAGPLVVENIELIGTNAGDYALGAQTCSGPGKVLHVTESCFIGVDFTPSVKGARTAQLKITVRGGRTYTVNVTGNGVEKVIPRDPEFTASPDTLDFGPRIMLSTGPALTATITNTGELPLKISSVAPVAPGTPEDFTVVTNGCFGISLASGEKCAVTVKFSPRGHATTAVADGGPTTPAARSAVLQFTDNTKVGVHLIGLTGAAMQPVLVVNPGVTPPGRVTSATGVAFPPGRTFTVRLADSIETSTAFVSADGTFKVDLVVFPKAAIGNRPVIASMTLVPGETPAANELGARTNLLIVYPTIDPTEFVTRR